MGGKVTSGRDLKMNRRAYAPADVTPSGPLGGERESQARMEKMMLDASPAERSGCLWEAASQPALNQAVKRTACTGWIQWSTPELDACNPGQLLDGFVFLSRYPIHAHAISTSTSFTSAQSWRHTSARVAASQPAIQPETTHFALLTFGYCIHELLPLPPASHLPATSASTF
ncbi:uncharacterized protein PAN0_011d4322 [Moesziomyces antarcticus]|uniref:Uncharacterized protein n=2 Tax=Pseudozyma antarctica TaxID=84753 RepID=A0A5C3FRQ4_PSEA2|nr:uncharacterized protein PAN0_011d4322 [Moesziomyces antarcticus]GAK66100.1 hypothetical protein PAN0_011d4322 [Moesziomyces antarcticus]SPO46876.1 uncharacterized protein PSANT_04562 [Moesziomyces antarcticus]